MRETRVVLNLRLNLRLQGKPLCGASVRALASLPRLRTALPDWWRWCLNVAGRSKGCLRDSLLWNCLRDCVSLVVCACNVIGNGRIELIRRAHIIAILGGCVRVDLQRQLEPVLDVTLVARQRYAAVAPRQARSCIIAAPFGAVEAEEKRGALVSLDQPRRTQRRGVQRIETPTIRQFSCAGWRDHLSHILPGRGHAPLRTISGRDGIHASLPLHVCLVTRPGLAMSSGVKGAPVTHR